ncbi:MAG: hypothetical protein GX208_03855 [Firmicutes bacterium]|nr:hypothetical protein [Bacillota bacterium]
MISAEVSLYPVETLDSDQVIMDSLKSITEYDLNYDIGSLSTHLRGDKEQVWSGIRAIHEKALATGHEVVMVVTISNAM